ncbi:axonemal dynein light chain domain-containing protein 1 [Discoglossus pictus]
MSVTEYPSPPTVPKPTPRRAQSSRSLVPAGAESPVLSNLREPYTALDHSQYLQTSQQNDFIPDEILQVLTSTANAGEKSDLAVSKKTKTDKDGKGGLRSIDPVWHHPFRRNRFKHLTEQPVCLTGAGRDISFLCDVLLMEKKKNAASRHPAAGDELQPQSSEGNIEDSLIPKEFYIVKNKGVLGLEYYEDKYTTRLQDDEKKLRIFPSMKPSGRAEVLQLMKVMDNMLKEAGVDEEGVKLEGPTQIHNLLELLKTEQTIYNIVFHELIRQVSVECVERGELLARLRQRYVMLLDKIPRQVLSLHTDLLAQRALDRCLTEEIIHFRDAIGELTNELYLVREHDVRVSKDAKHAQEELAKALKEAKKNANLLQEYRELYELQRCRLETQLEHLTEEKDLWSSATYRLARKVIEANQLQLARRLYLSENSWTKVIRHLLVLLASTDTTDLSKIQQIAETWRGHMTRFELEIERNEESGLEKLKLIRSQLEKWQLHIQENIFVDKNFQGVPDEMAYEILKDVMIWENMLTEEMQHFEGDLLLGNRESLKTAADIQKQWVDLGDKVLRRHQRMNGELAPEHKVMEDMNSSIHLLYEQYRRRVEGENGVARTLMMFFNSLHNWSLFMQTFKDAPYRMTETDWSTFCQLIPDWIAQADKTMGLIGSIESEEKLHMNSVKKVQSEDIYRMLQQWVLATTNETEKDDVHLTQKATNLHTAMVQFMVNMLILLSPDHSSNPSELTFATQFEEEAFNEVTGEKIQEEAKSLSEKVSCFSGYITSCCQEMVEKISMEKLSLAYEDPDNELKELEKVKNSCNEWIETCQLILSHATRHIFPSKTLQHESSGKVSEEDTQHFGTDNLAEGDDLSKTTDKEEEILITPKHILNHPSHGNMEQSQEKTMVKVGTEDSQIEDFSTTTGRNHPQDNMEPENNVVRIIGYDGNIHDKTLNIEKIPVSPEGVLTASQPGTSKSMQAFEYLTSLEQFENRLLLTEQRALKAEERAESLDEQLKATLQKIQELEKKHQRDESAEKVEELASDLQIAVEEPTSTPRHKKTPKSAKSKHQK